MLYFICENDPYLHVWKVAKISQENKIKNSWKPYDIKGWHGGG